MKMRMNNLALMAVLLLVNVSALAQMQGSAKDGGYISFEEFKTNSPKYSAGLVVEKRSKTNILLWGGSDYEVESTDKAITGKIVKKEIWGIMQRDTLYLNQKNLSGLNGFVKVEILDKYSFVRIGIPTNKIQKELGIRKEDYLFGAGALGGAIQGGQLATIRFSLIYDMQNNRKWLLTKDNVLLLLDNHKDLKTEYLAETDIEKEDILLKYLKKLNELETDKI
jgi:hypothetical protein